MNLESRKLDKSNDENPETFHLLRQISASTKQFEVQLGQIGYITGNHEEICFFCRAWPYPLRHALTRHHECTDQRNILLLSSMNVISIALLRQCKLASSANL